LPQLQTIFPEAQQKITASQITGTRKKIILAAVALVCVAALIIGGILLFGESDQDKIHSCLDSYASALNSGDTEAMYDCFDKTTRNLLQASENVGSDLLGVGLGDLVAIGAGLNAGSGGDGMKLEIKSLTMESKASARVDVIVHMTMADPFFGISSKEQWPEQLQMVKEGSAWKISGQEAS
jgi:hypothetical protein